MTIVKKKSEFKLVGVIHLPPLPGAVNFQNLDVRKIARIAAKDAANLVKAGFTHVMIQDGNDFPQPTSANIATIASLAAVGLAVREAIEAPLGVIAGHNDGAASVAIGKAIGADFIRVKTLTGVASGPNGWIQGCAHSVGAMKRLIESEIEIWADANEVTSKPIFPDKTWAARESLNFGGAAKIIITNDLGSEFALQEIEVVRSNIGAKVDYIVGGRVTLAKLPMVIKAAEGAIIGSAINVSGLPQTLVDIKTAEAFGRALELSK